MDAARGITVPFSSTLTFSNEALLNGFVVSSNLWMVFISERPLVPAFKASPSWIWSKIIEFFPIDILCWISCSSIDLDCSRPQFREQNSNFYIMRHNRKIMTSLSSEVSFKVVILNGSFRVDVPGHRYGNFACCRSNAIFRPIERMKQK